MGENAYEGAIEEGFSKAWEVTLEVSLNSYLSEPTFVIEPESLQGRHLLQIYNRSWALATCLLFACLHFPSLPILLTQLSSTD